MKKPIDLVKKWSVERQLHKANPEKQVIKLGEEFGELCDGINKNKAEKIKDSLGDILVVVIILSQQLAIEVDYDYHMPPTGYADILDVFYYAGLLSHQISHKANKNTLRFNLELLLSCLHSVSEEQGLTLKECLTYAYDQIKGRKGQMVNGVFVKNEDLR